MQTKEEILAEKEVYWNSVLFFAAFFTFCNQNNISCLVEPKLKDKDGNPKFPDFAFFEKKVLKVVLEHKGSLPKDAEKVNKIISETKEKYEILEINSHKFIPRVVLFFPKSCEETINKIDKTNVNLEIIIFNLRDEESITFIWFIKKPVKEPMLEKIVGSRIPCNEDDFSKYKFIRKDPHPIYTAWILKNIIFPYFKTPYSYGKEKIRIRLENIYKQAESLFPPWVQEDIKQVTFGRINKALDFLKFIKFIDLDPIRKEVIFYNNKGAKVGDLLDYFAKKWVLYSKKKNKSVKKKLEKGQKDLSEWQK